MIKTTLTTDFAQLVAEKDRSENGARRRLVQILFNNLLRKKGISPTWIECRTSLVFSRSSNRHDGLHVMLILRQWDDLIVKYSFALQAELVADIERFEPLIFSWLHGISWQLDVQETCPHAVMPDTTFWQDTKAMSMY
jgi:hypothetical protein